LASRVQRKLKRGFCRRKGINGVDKHGVCPDQNGKELANRIGGKNSEGKSPFEESMRGRKGDAKAL